MYVVQNTLQLVYLVLSEKSQAETPIGYKPCYIKKIKKEQDMRKRMLLFAQATGRIFRCSTVVSPLPSPVTSETIIVFLIIA